MCMKYRGAPHCHSLKTSWHFVAVIICIANCGVGEVRNNDWDDANPATWDTHTSTPQYQVSCGLHVVIPLTADRKGCDVISVKRKFGGCLGN